MSSRPTENKRGLVIKEYLKYATRFVIVAENIKEYPEPHLKIVGRHSLGLGFTVSKGVVI